MRGNFDQRALEREGGRLSVSEVHALMQLQLYLAVLCLKSPEIRIDTEVTQPIRVVTVAWTWAWAWDVAHATINWAKLKSQARRKTCAN